MTPWVDVAGIRDLEDGGMKTVPIGGREFLLARARGQYFCADGLCPHLKGELSRGTLTGTVVTCPDHYSQFDLASGAILRWTNLTGVVARADLQAHPPKPLAVYEVKVEGDRVLVRLP
ncbi:MAG: 3-phenylpropionate dioxygenase ferredoxin subunit [Methanocella sp. PtaU1.Bin125]|nr:MAG: 3-phenylpropionate dioxygenase ferredoxin subunit [Methanocella sp. PtaU1.Bin125]